MSKKLSIEQQRSNAKALYYFKQECDSYHLFTSRVKAFSGRGNILFDDDVSVRVVVRHSWEEVEVIWEDIGLSEEDYKNLGLYGIYSTTYNKMSFSEKNNQLKIQSNDSKIYLLINAK